MNIAHTLSFRQAEFPSTRKERRQIQRALERKLRRLKPDVFFDNTSTTAFGAYFTLATFKEAIGFRQMLDNHISPLKHWNSTYSTTDLFDCLTDACLLGQTRFDHTTALRYDPGYLTIKDLERFPSERRFRDLMSRCTEETCVPGNVVGAGWYRRVRLAANAALQYILRKIKENLDLFLWFVANGFQPLRI